MARKPLSGRSERLCEALRDNLRKRKKLPESPAKAGEDNHRATKPSDNSPKSKKKTNIKE